MKLCKINFRYQQIVHSIHTTQQHKTGVVNIYLYGCVNLLAPVCCIFVCVCLCLCVCNIKSESTSKKPHYQSIPQTHFASYFQKGKIFPSGKESVFPFQKNHPLSEDAKFKLSPCMSLAFFAVRNISFLMMTIIF